MKQYTKVNLHNRFDIEVKDSRTGEIKQEAYAENIILNQAWAQICSTGYWFTRIYYGTGTGTISATRTALFTPLGYKEAGNDLYTENQMNDYYSYRRSIVILETEHIGAALSEVGVGTTTLCTHALLRDMNGNPVTIVKTDTDIITIYATIFLKTSTHASATTGISLIHNGATNPLATHLMGVNPTTDWKLSLNEDPYTVTIVPTIDVANKRYTWYHRIPAASANAYAGHRMYRLNSYYGGRFNGDSVVGRFRDGGITQSQIVEQIGTGDGTTTDFATKFPFVKSGAVIKVDGVVASPTVYTDLPNNVNLGYHMLNVTDPNFPDAYTLYTPTTGWIPETPQIIENPYYATYGIDTIHLSKAIVESSDDGVVWEPCVTAFDATVPVPSGQKNKRYFRVKRDPGAHDLFYIYAFNCNALQGIKNVRFASAPATGAVITAEYTCDCAAKDANHVLDITVTIQLGEYSP